jgi:uncharacterized protein (DUF1697 family)
MPIYIALLRGINVGPHKRMKMEKLRASCEALGMKSIATYIQSGNLVFQAAKLSPQAVSKKLESQIVKDFGFAAEVFTRTADELGQIVKDNPLPKESSVDASKLHVLFLGGIPEPAAIEKLESLTLAPDKVRHRGKEVYFYFPNGVSGSSIWKHNLDRVLGISATMRNWKTVTMLNEMATQCA